MIEPEHNHPSDASYHENCPRCYALLETWHLGEKDWQRHYGWHLPVAQQ